MVEQKQVLEQFKKEIQSNIISHERDIKDLYRRKKDTEKNLIYCIKHLDLRKKEIKHLKEYDKNIDTSIQIQIEEIKKLPFVKGLKFTSNGISIDVGRIDINYKAIDYYIGDFTILITPYGVEIKNRNPVIVTDDGYKEIYEHPHMNDYDICFGGERTHKINEFISNFQLKQLVYMVYLFLKTYTDRDYYSPISKFNKDAKRKVKKEVKK